MFSVSLFVISAALLAPADSTDAILRQGVDAMGGEVALRAIHTVEIAATEQRNALEQSERPEGPYLVETSRVREWRDQDGHRWRRAAETDFAWLKFSSTTIVADNVAARAAGDRLGTGTAQDVDEANAAFDLSPDQILLTALASPDRRRLPTVALHAVPHDVVQFRWRDRPMTIFLSAETHLPSAVEWTQAFPDDMFWSLWGDVTTRVTYSMWWLADGGVRYPLQANLVRNGMPAVTRTITELTLNGAAAADLFSIPPATRSAYASRPPDAVDAQPLPVARATDLAAGVVFIRGSWNTTLIAQPDGVVVIEAPISSGYSSQVVAEAAKRFPGLRIKAVISTSDSWPHVAGVREYVARGIPVYVLDRNRPLLERVVRAPRTKSPDSLAKAPRQPAFVEVHGRIVIGSGANRVELYPTRGQTTERQMIVYLPEYRLLYGSDAFQTLNGQYFYPQTVAEIRDAVAREHLDVDRFFMMHMPVTPWSEALAVRGGPIPH